MHSVGTVIYYIQTQMVISLCPHMPKCILFGTI